MPHTHTAMPSRPLLVHLLSRIWVHALLLLVTQPEIMCTVHIMHANTLERTLSAIIAFYFGIRHTVHARGSENPRRPCFELNCIGFCSSARIGTAPGSEFHHIVPHQEIHGLGQFHWVAWEAHKLKSRGGEMLWSKLDAQITCVFTFASESILEGKKVELIGER